MQAGAPAIEELVAPPGWHCIEFISDLHLQAAGDATFNAWRSYLRGTQADAVFMLGDLFELWVGDDAAMEPGLAADCAAVLREAAQRRPHFFMHGNRDFLVGQHYLGSAGVQLLPDPTVLTFGDARWLLTHGDALCLSDTAYQQFRAQVRDTEWQRRFLAQPLAQRQAVARGLREESESRKQAGADYGDLDVPAMLDWLLAADAPVMIHGHTHRPADQALDATHSRIVLSDWDAQASPPRLEVLRLTAAGAQRVSLA